ncbi:MAG: MFS transporter [Thermoleophilia bacterium]|nr:MFS transporter [Thermoleophilia bacterium]
MTPAATPLPVGRAEQRAVLVATTLGSFVTPFILSSLTVALPAIGREFSLSAVQLGWVSTSYLLVTAALLVPFGSVADRYGRKRIFLIGMVVASLASVLCALAPSFEWLIAFRALQAVGGAMTFATVTALLSGVYPPGERGRVLGINVAAVYIGLSVGPVVGGVLTESFGWRSVFAVSVVMGLLAAALVIWRIKGEWKEHDRGRFDYLGAVVFAAGLAVLMWGISQLPGADGVGLMALGVVLLALFTWWETRVSQPVLNVDLFRHNRIFALSNLAALISYSATFSVSFLLALYLQYVKGFSAEKAGLVLVFQPALQAILSPWAGRLSDRVESRVVVSVGMGVTAGGLLVLSFLRPTTPVWYIIGTLCLLGLGFALFSSPNTNTVMSSVDRRYFGVASATLGTMRMMGQMFSMGLAMVVFALFLGSAQAQDADPGTLTTSMRLLFAISAALCVVGVFASMARGTLDSD